MTNIPIPLRLFSKNFVEFILGMKTSPASKLLAKKKAIAVIHDGFHKHCRTQRPSEVLCRNWYSKRLRDWHLTDWIHQTLPVQP
jgi:hypothetical protein